MPRIELQPKQQEVLDTTANEILYGGSAGAGKSFLMRAMSIILASQIEGVQVFLFRRKSSDLYSNHFIGSGSYYDLLSDWIECGYCRITTSPSIKIEFQNGSIIHCRHCFLEKNKYDFQGAEIHVLLIDELTHFSESIYRYLRGRCRISTEIRDRIEAFKKASGLKMDFPFILCGSNPGGVGHNWVKKTFIDIQPPYEVMRTDDKDGGFLRQFIPGRLSDNPSLDEEEYKKALYGLGDDLLVEAMLEGNWDIVTGGAFGDVWSAEHNIVEPFALPKEWYFDRSFDWGSSHPFSVNWFAESNGEDVKLKDGTYMHTQRGDIFLFAEFYGWNGEANKGCNMLAVEVADKIKAIEKRIPLKIRPGPADTSIFSKQNGNCIADDMASRGIKWTKADKSPGSRATGLEVFRTYVKNASTKAGPALYVFNTCRQFIRTIPTLPRDEIKIDDIDTNAEDHIYDAVRYRLATKRSKVSSGGATGMG